MRAVSLASLVPAVWSPAGTVVPVCARPLQNPATVNTWHPLFLSLVGVGALEPAKSCGSLGGAWEVLWWE